MERRIRIHDTQESAAAQRSLARTRSVGSGERESGASYRPLRRVASTLSPVIKPIPIPPFPSYSSFPPHSLRDGANPIPIHPLCCSSFDRLFILFFLFFFTRFFHPFVLALFVYLLRFLRFSYLLLPLLLFPISFTLLPPSLSSYSINLNHRPLNLCTVGCYQSRSLGNTERSRE